MVLVLNLSPTEFWVFVLDVRCYGRHWSLTRQVVTVLGKTNMTFFLRLAQTRLPRRPIRFTRERRVFLGFLRKMLQDS